MIFLAQLNVGQAADLNVVKMKNNIKSCKSVDIFMEYA